MQVYKKNRVDTILFYLGEEFDVIDSCRLKAIQIDGKGNKEIVISWQYSGHSMSTNVGGFETGFSKVEIWNVDTHKMLFGAMPSYYYYSSYFQSSYSTNVDSLELEEEPIEIVKKCSYDYDFNIDDMGKIQISSLKKRFNDNICEPPDHQEGTYIFKNGAYVLVEEKKNNMPK